MSARLLVLLLSFAMGCSTAQAQPAPAKGPPPHAKAPPTKGPPPYAKAPPTKGPPPQAAKAAPSPADQARMKRQVAKIGDTVITVGEIEARINEQSPFLRSRYTDPARRTEFLENMVRFELLARAAQKKGYGRDSEVRRNTDQMMVQVLTREEFDERMTAESVTDADIQAYYDAHQDEYNKPEMVRASHILVADDTRAAHLLEQAVDAKADNRAFRRLAQDNSEDDATKSRGGDLRYFPRDGRREEGDPEVPREVVAAAFALKNVGDVSPRPIKSAKGWHVVKLTGRRDPIHRTIADVAPQIRNRLWREKRSKAMEDFVANLRSTRPVEIHEDMLNLVKVNPPRGNEGGVEPGEMPEVPGGAGEAPHP